MDIKARIEQLLKKVVSEEKDLCLALKSHKITLDTPKLKQFGDYSSNLSLVLSKSLNKPALEIAQQLQCSLQKQLVRAKLKSQIEKIEVKGAGFINFFLSRDCLYEILLEIRKKGSSFGRLKQGSGKTVHLEFVSANPTGPLNVAHARQAAFGDTLASLMQFANFRVIREYYLNDEGTQIDILRDSVRAKYLKLLGLEAKFPASGYQGKYIDDLAAQIRQRYGSRLIKENPKNLSFFARFAYSKILEGIKKDLQRFGVRFDRWFSQKSLAKQGKITKAISLLKAKGFLYQQEGAWWLRSTKFGDDKDRVVIKSDATLTYIAADIAYHQVKFKRNFSQIINIWGPDHHGYIARLKAAVAALGFDQNLLTVLIVQLVSLSSAEKIIPMSTRRGEFVSLHDIIQAVGKDVARFFFLMR
ncbi:MAG: arginine--tRNA ligase, partial [Candidatus Omnitrophica bacterium]|nr:arginine--tRNA ligase [Candidatus Omnitrophota bacterium]